MIHKLTKDEYNHFLIKSDKQISDIFEILDKKENVDVLTSLIFKSASFTDLEKEFPKMDKKVLSSLIIKAKGLGLVEFTKAEKYHTTEVGKNFFHSIVHLIIESHINHGIPHDKMKKIITDYVGKDELDKRKKEKEIEHAKEVELGLFPV